MFVWVRVVVRGGPRVRELACCGLVGSDSGCVFPVIRELGWNGGSSFGLTRTLLGDGDFVS